MTDREIWREYAKTAAAGMFAWGDERESYDVTSIPIYVLKFADEMLKTEKERWKDDDTDTGEF